MSAKNSNSHFLFESSLELKCLLFSGLALVVIVALSCFFYFNISKKQIDTQNPLMGQLLCEREFLLMHLRVLSHKEAENSFATEDEASDLDDFIDSMASQSPGINIGESSSKFHCRLLRTANYRENDDDRPTDDFEKTLLKENQGVVNPAKINDLPQMKDRIDESGNYHYYKLLRMEHSCQNCHGSAEESELGSLLGVIHVMIPEPPSRQELTRLWALLLGAGVITAFLGLVAFYIVIRYVVCRPLRKLRLVSEAISDGDISRRADLHTGDEFEALGIAFNRMLQFLMETQEELKETNSALETNVDELAKRNLQLFEMNRVKSDFMATMSHELRTPLNSILGFSDVLATIKTLDEKQRRYVENIRKSGNMLLSMINDILDLARIEAGRIEYKLSHFTIDKIVDAQCDMARPLIDRKNLVLTEDIQENLPEMYQDPGRIQQILNNLLSNAIKFTPEGGRISVAVAKISLAPLYPQENKSAVQNNWSSSRSQDEFKIEYMEMKVTDTGVGVSEEERKTIFEKFRQGSSAAPGGDALKREFSGSGLGLSIVKELCRILEGDVSVESEQGCGSTFTVLLPWNFEPPIQMNSPMMSDLQKFSQSGVFRKNTPPDSL